MLYFLSLYIYYNKNFYKNQKSPPYGKPYIIIRVAGYIMGKISFAYPIPFLRGQFRVEMTDKFAVIVPINAFLLENRAKRGEMMRFCGEIQKYT